MEKLKLDFDELAVESFAAADGVEPGGTVRAHDLAPTNYTLYAACTCYRSCVYTACPADCA
ncbi:MAG TPA: hypothetical protein VF746_24525 [Longimicrobium sp.]|jgi:hypothetical protein